MSKYMVIGVSRTLSKSVKRSKDASRIPKHLLIKNIPELKREANHFPFWHEDLSTYDRRDKISIANIDHIVNGQAQVLTIPICRLSDFNQQYHLEDYSKNLDRSGSTNFPNNQPMIIINKIGNIGCQCLNVTGKLYNLRNADVLKYANSFGIANAKVYEKIGHTHNTIIISGIGWTIPVITTEQAISNTKRTNIPVKGQGKLEHFATKAALMGADQFEVDIQTSTLIKCKPGKYGRLVLPPVKVIGWDSMSGVNAEEIVIPTTVRVIGARAFSGTITNTLTILGNIENVSDVAFVLMRGLKDVNIGKEVRHTKFLGQFVEYLLDHITVSEDNSYLKSVDGIIYTKDMKQLVFYPTDHSQEEYIMPDTVEGTLKTNSLILIRNLKRIKISDRITRLEAEAINECPNLEQIELGTGLKQVEDNAILCKEYVTKQIIVNSPVELKANKHYIVPSSEYDIKFGNGKMLLDTVNLIQVVYKASYRNNGEV